MRDQEAEQIAKRLDMAYRSFIGARASVKASILGLLQAAVHLGKVVEEARGPIRGSFAKWCRVHCTSYDVNLGQMALAVALKVGDGERRIETWWLRSLGVISAIHHAVRPASAKRRVKPTSWISSIARTHDGVAKLIEQAGGIQRMDPMTRRAVARQLSTLDELRAKLEK